jgi:hypothetical protein
VYVTVSKWVCVKYRETTANAGSKRECARRLFLNKSLWPPGP